MRTVLHNLLLRQLLIGVAALALFGGIAFYMFGHVGQNVAHAQITNVLMARGLDQNGNPIGIGQKFDPAQDSSVYAVVNLKNATKQTQVAYVRYFNGRYVDSKVTVPSKDGVPTVFFYFEKGVGAYPPGNYTLTTYVDGKRAVQADYAYVANALGHTTTRSGAKTNLAAVTVATGTDPGASATTGKMAFVLSGSVVATSTTSITLRVKNTSKNMLTLKNSTQVLPVTKHTRVTKNARPFSLKSMTVGSTVRIYGIYDKVASRFGIQWIRVQR